MQREQCKEDGEGNEMTVMRSEKWHSKEKYGND